MRELLFYPAIKNEEGKYEPIIFNSKNKPQQIYWKTQSFIDISAFTEVKPSLTKEDLVEDYKNCFSEYGENETLYLYPFTLEELRLMADEGNNGLESGYVNIEDASVYYSLDDKYDRQDFFHWEIGHLYPAKYILALPQEEQKKYMEINHLDTYSGAYTANLLYEILDRMPDYNKSTAYNICILVDYSF